MTLNKIEEHCLLRRYSLSQKRKQVIQQLAAQTEAADAETIWRMLIDKNAKVSIASVYMILNWLAKEGLIERRVSDERKFYYRLENQNKLSDKP